MKSPKRDAFEIGRAFALGAGVVWIGLAGVSTARAQIPSLGHSQFQLRVPMGGGAVHYWAGRDASGAGTATLGAVGTLRLRPHASVFMDALASARVALGQQSQVDGRLSIHGAILPDCAGATPSGQRRLCYVVPIFGDAQAYANAANGASGADGQVGTGLGLMVRDGHAYLYMAATVALHGLQASGSIAGALGNTGGAHSVLGGLMVDGFFPTSGIDREGVPNGVRVRTHFQIGSSFAAWLDRPENRSSTLVVPIVGEPRVSGGYGYSVAADVQVPVWTFRSGAVRRVSIDGDLQIQSVRVATEGRSTPEFGSIPWRTTHSIGRGQGGVAISLQFL